MKFGLKGLVLASTVGLGLALVSGCNSEEAPPASPPPMTPSATKPAPAPKAADGEKAEAPKADAAEKKEG